VFCFLKKKLNYNEEKTYIYWFNSAEMNPINGVKPMEGVIGA
jgi:hypothetical protein